MLKQDQKVAFNYFDEIKGEGRIYGVVQTLPVLGVIYIVLIESISCETKYRCMTFPEITLTVIDEPQPKDTDAVLGGN